MKLPRRTFLHLAAGAAALPAVSAFRVGASLSVAAGALYRHLCCRRLARHHRTSDRPMALGATRTADHCRESAGCRRQYRHGNRRESAAGRLHAPHGPVVERNNPAIYDNLPFNFIRGCPTHRSPYKRVAHFFFESAILARIAAR